MIRVLAFLLLLFLLNACDTYELPNCNFDDATQELFWLKDIIEQREQDSSESMKYCYISQASLKRKKVFVFGDCNPSIDKVIFIHNCDGDLIKNKKGENITLGEVRLKDQRIIWKPIDFACEFNAGATH